MLEKVVKRWREIALQRELPTWLLIFTIYAGWLALTFWWQDLPLWAASGAGAWLCAWHMSLQHELMHGHPTRNQRLNNALAWPPLNLWLPYALYRESHLRHHTAAHLTDPLEDPESTYMSAQAWAGACRARRKLHWACNTLVGRIVLGPACTIIRFWIGQARRAGTAGSWRVWVEHAIGAGLVLTWACVVCRIHPLIYLACFVYPGTALIMVRSLVEHRAADRPEDRTAVVEQAGLLGLLYLNNNLHVLHHERPSIPWYGLPAQWRLLRGELLAGRNGPVYRNYLDVASRYALRPQHGGPHPLLPSAP